VLCDLGLVVGARLGEVVAVRVLQPPGHNGQQGEEVGVGTRHL